MTPPSEAAAANTSYIGRALRDWGLLAFAVTVLGFTILASALSRRTASSVAKLPPDEQAALYARTLENLRTVCAGPAQDLQDYCAGEAAIALQLPQCDDSCRALAKPFTNQPTR